MKKLVVAMPIHQQQVLTALADGGEEMGYFAFAALCSKTGLPRKLVRRSCRALAKKGWSQYGRGLWCEDGNPGGSGYAITQAGRAILRDKGWGE
jgi:hypothetical protein